MNIGNEHLRGTPIPARLGGGYLGWPDGDIQGMVTDKRGWGQMGAGARWVGDEWSDGSGPDGAGDHYLVPHHLSGNPSTSLLPLPIWYPILLSGVPPLHGTPSLSGTPPKFGTPPPFRYPNPHIWYPIPYLVPHPDRRYPNINDSPMWNSSLLDIHKTFP